MSNVTISAPATTPPAPDIFTAIAGVSGLLPGMAVSWSPNVPGEVVLCSGVSSSSQVDCCGLVQSTYVNASGLTIVTVRRGGVLSLSVAQWNAVVVGATTGLSPGLAAYVAQTTPTAGMLYNGSGIASPGDFIIPVGIAIDSLNLQVTMQIPVTLVA